MSAKFELEKFSGENDFGLWKMKMEAVLTKEGLALALKGESELPETMKDSEKQDMLEKAKSSLILGLGDKVLREIKKEKTAAEIWNRLDTLYQAKTVPNRLFLKQRLFGFKMDEQKSLKDNKDEFLKLIQDLESISVEVDDEDQAVILLNALPKSYSNFVETLKYGRQTLKLEEVVEAISAKDSENRMREKHSNDGEGLNVRGRFEKKSWKKGGQYRNRSKSRTGNRKCFFCHKEGHFRRDCPERKSKKKYEKESEGGSADVATEGYESSEVLFISEGKTSEEWILDTGCTYHMTPRKEWFSSFQPVDGGTTRKIAFGDKKF